MLVVKTELVSVLRIPLDLADSYSVSLTKRYDHLFLQGVKKKLLIFSNKSQQPWAVQVIVDLLNVVTAFLEVFVLSTSEANSER